MGRAQIIPRLMSRPEAAAYCGFSVSVFDRECTVRPIDFGDRRLERFDRYDLDAWIEQRKAPVARLKTVDEALAEF